MKIPSEGQSPLQSMFDRLSAGWQNERAETQMTLGKLIKALEDLPPDRKINGLGKASSYRGYYDDLAFEPNEEEATVADALKCARGCMGQVFQGYKGGDFLMGERTPVWSAEWGSCGQRIMGLNVEENPIILALAPDSD